MSYPKKWRNIGIGVATITLISLSFLSSSVHGAEEVTTETIVEFSEAKSEEMVVHESARQADPELAEISKEEAVERLRTVMPVLEKADTDRVELRRVRKPGSEEQIVWNVHWNYSDGHRSYGFSSEVDAITGDIIQASLHGPLLEEEDSYFPPELSREEAIAKAKTFLKQAAPSLEADSFQVNDYGPDTAQPLFGAFHYNLTFTPYINEVPAPDQQISLTLNGNGDVINFYNRTGQETYPAPEPSITLEEATDTFKEDLLLEKSYFAVRKGTNEYDVFLGWQPKQGNMSMILDAHSNEYLGQNGEKLDGTNTNYEPIEVDNAFEAIDPVKGDTITSDQAADVVKEVANIEEGQQLISESLRENHHQFDGPVWELVWQPEDPSQPGGDIRAAVNAKTGQLITLHAFQYPVPRPTEQADPSNTDESLKTELKEKAISYISQLYPNAKENLQLVSNNAADANEDVVFQFQRFVDGIPVQNDHVYLTLDQDGHITNYTLNITPDLEQHIGDLEIKIDKEEATKLYLKHVDPELQYRTFRAITGNVQEEPQTKLVYSMASTGAQVMPAIIDAETGEWKKPIGQPGQSSPTEEPKDIESHAFEEDLQTLASFNILPIDKDGNVHPDAGIRYGEWLEMMAKAVSPHFENRYRSENETYKNIPSDDRFYDAVIFAREQGWLNESDEEVSVNEVMTREQLADSMIRIMQYEKIASHIGESLDFEDSKNITHKGAVHILAELGLFDKESDKFHPGKEVSIGEAASKIIRLASLQGEIDQRIGIPRY